MKKFLVKVVLFAIPLVFAAYLGDGFLSNALKKSKDDDLGVWNAIYAGNINSDVVVYGASRALDHFDPQIMEDSLKLPAYNLGMDGHNFWLEYLRHSIFLEHNRRPKIIVYSVDPSTLQKRSDLYDPDQFLPYMLRDTLMQKFTSSYKGYDYFDYRLPLLRYYGREEVIFQAIGLSLHPERYAASPSNRPRGYRAWDLKWNDDFEKAKKSLGEIRMVPDSGSIRLFGDFLAECKAMGITVVFVTTPEYVEGQKLVENRDAMLSFFRDFSRQYGVPFLDYSNDSISYDKKYFFNSQHMNKTGSELFTKTLAHDLKKALPDTVF